MLAWDMFWIGFAVGTLVCVLILLSADDKK